MSHRISAPSTRGCRAAPKTDAEPPAPPVHAVVAMQRTAGNRAVAAWVAARRIHRDELSETEPGSDSPSGTAAGGELGTDSDLGEPVVLPRMADVVQSPRVEAARRQD